MAFTLYSKTIKADEPVITNSAQGTEASLLSCLIIEEMVSRGGEGGAVGWEWF